MITVSISEIHHELGGFFCLENKQYASPESIHYLITLREQRGLPFKDFSQASQKEIENEISLVKGYYPASQLQIKTIKEITARLNNIGVPTYELTDQDFTELTGGKNGTAYQYIQQLIETEKEEKLNMPLSKEQADYIHQMLLCPDITWTNHNINDRVIYPDGTFRILDKQEFVKELSKKLTKSDAYDFIEKYRGAFNTWKKTRIRPNQAETIKKYEKYLASLEYKRERLFARDFKTEEQARKPLRTVYDPIAHKPLDDDQLKLFSKENASAYIKQLKYAIQAKRLYLFKKERNKDDDFEEIRSINDTSEWATREFRTLHSMIYSLQKESGVVNDQITHLFPYQDVYTKASRNDPFFTDTKKHALIIDYMYHIVTTHAMSFNELRLKCLRSSIAMDFLEATKNRLLNNKKFMETLLYKE